MTEVIGTDEFKIWYDQLKDTEREAVTRAVDILELMGLRLGSPNSSAVNGSRHALRELRVQAAGKPLRIFYVFDPYRRTVLLLGGNKGGDNRFYEVYVPLADACYDQYLREIGAEGELRNGTGKK